MSTSWEYENKITKLYTDKKGFKKALKRVEKLLKDRDKVQEALLKNYLDERFRGTYYSPCVRSYFYVVNAKNKLFGGT